MQEILLGKARICGCWSRGIRSFPAFRNIDTASQVVTASHRGFNGCDNLRPRRTDLPSRETEAAKIEDAQTGVPLTVDLELLTPRVLSAVDLDDESAPDDEVDPKTDPEFDLRGQFDAPAGEAESRHGLPVRARGGVHIAEEPGLPDRQTIERPEPGRAGD
jgi:hypothetical protein